MFGAGYANAADRLFLMDVLRHTGRAELSSFIGGSPINRAMDRGQWQFAPYTDADLQRQFDLRRRALRRDGRRSCSHRRAGLHRRDQRLHRRRRWPTRRCCPPSTRRSASTPQPWTVTDLVAEASLIGGIFGKGGGTRARLGADPAGVRQAASAARQGRRAWSDFRSKNDPEAPTTVAQALPLRDRPARSPSAASRSRTRAAVTDAPVAPAVEAAPAPRSARAPASATSARSCAVRAAGPGHASNWELVSARESKTGHPIGVLGPQVGYYQPQILMEEDIHGPGIDARGADLPRRRPLRAARPRPRLRLERDDGDLGQRRHLRRGPLPGRLPLPLARAVPGDGQARAARTAGRRTRST